MNSFFTLHSFLEVGKTQDLPSKFWQTLVDALSITISSDKIQFFLTPQHKLSPPADCINMANLKGFFTVDHITT
jgi:hypothetical protein